MQIELKAAFGENMTQKQLSADAGLIDLFRYKIIGCCLDQFNNLPHFYLFHHTLLNQTFFKKILSRTITKSTLHFVMITDLQHNRTSQTTFNKATTR